jgi:hypothetical protein
MSTKAERTLKLAEGFKCGLSWGIGATLGSVLGPMAFLLGLWILDWLGMPWARWMRELLSGG